jgi:hypothetical protein
MHFILFFGWFIPMMFFFIAGNDINGKPVVAIMGSICMFSLFVQSLFVFTDDFNLRKEE